jgi:hypothetical protein
MYLQELRLARKVSFTISDEQEELLRSCFAADSKALPAETAQLISEAALQSWIGIFSGKTKYRSLNELYLDWLERVFNEIDPEAKPSQRYLFQRLNFSHGQAAYFTRVLLDKQNSRWREKAKVELRDVLVARKAEVDQIIKAGQSYVQKLDFDLSKAARLELNLLLETLHDAGEKKISPPQLVGTYGDRGTVSLVAAMVPLLLNNLPEAKAK